MKTCVDGVRLACFRKTADAAFWDEHWRGSLTRAAYRGFDGGQLGCFEGAFTRNLPREGRILEAGCGIGQYVVALRARGYDAEGVEWGGETVAAVRAIWPDLPVRNGDVTALPVPDGHYAAYISMGVMEHRIDGPAQFLTEARRVLSAEGVAFISVPWVHRLRAVKRVLRLYATKGEGSFYQYIYPKAAFRETLEQAGFIVIEQIPYDAVNGLCAESRFLRWCFERTTVGRRLAARLAITGSLDRWFGHMMLFVCRKRSA